MWARWRRQRCNSPEEHQKRCSQKYRWPTSRLSFAGFHGNVSRRLGPSFFQSHGCGRNSSLGPVHTTRGVLESRRWRWLCKSPQLYKRNGLVLHVTQLLCLLLCSVPILTLKRTLRHIIMSLIRLNEVPRKKWGGKNAGLFYYFIFYLNNIYSLHLFQKHEAYPGNL